MLPDIPLGHTPVDLHNVLFEEITPSVWMLDTEGPEGMA